MLAIESMSGVGRSGAKPRYSSVTFAKSDCNCREARNQTAIDAAERFSPIFVALPKFRLQMSQAAPEDCKYSALVPTIVGRQARRQPASHTSAQQECSTPGVEHSCAQLASRSGARGLFWRGRQRNRCKWLRCSQCQCSGTCCWLSCWRC